jgi:hypothetical protein
MKVWKIRQYLPALLLYIQRRLEGGRGFFGCGEDAGYMWGG